MPHKKTYFQLESQTACVFCGKDEKNEFLYGKLLQGKTFSVHHNCLFFASGLSQRGRNESEGILGFLISDIKQEVLRGKKLKCFHCKRKGATVGCCKVICRKTYHFPCGIQNQSLNQFFGSFSSYCQSHRPVQIPREMPEEEIYCHICFLPFSEEDLNSCLYSNCCNHNLFHKTCLQKYALNAGRHFFKCPLCNNSSDFMKEMEFYGVCVPEKDASWELEENAYEDLLYRPECGADDCLCTDGRKYNGNSAWALLTCSDCGAGARHCSCANLEDDETTWKCNECKVLEDQILKKRMNRQNSLEMTDNTEHLDSVEQLNTSFEMQSSVSEPGCSNICSNDLPLLKAETENLPNCSDVTTKRNKHIVCENSLPFPMIPCKTPTTSNNVDSKATESTSLKEKIALQESNSNAKKRCLVDNIVNQMKKEKTQHKPTFILNCNSIKTSKSNRQSKVKKGKAIKKFKPGCCSGNSQQCIKKMFGLQCHNIRI